MTQTNLYHSYSQHYIYLLQIIFTSFFMRECQIQVNISPSTLKEKTETKPTITQTSVNRWYARFKQRKCMCICVSICVHVCVCVCVCLLYQSVTLFIWLRLREVWLTPGLHQSVTWAALHWTALCTQTLTSTHTNTSQINHLYQCNTSKMHSIHSNYFL